MNNSFFDYQITCHNCQGHIAGIDSHLLIFLVPVTNICVVVNTSYYHRHVKGQGQLLVFKIYLAWQISWR